MALSDAKARNAKLGPKSYKISDGDGLFLLVHNNGSKYWRMKYVWMGREKTLAFGVYPHVSLADARDLRSKAQKMLAAGQDPGAARQEFKRKQLTRAQNTFELITREWLEKRDHRWAEATKEQIRKRLERHAFPKLGNHSVAEIKPSEVLDMLRVMENAEILDTAHRVQQNCVEIFTYAIATGRADRNPAAEVQGALKTKKEEHHAYLEEMDLPEFFQKLAAYDGDVETRLALNFLLLTFVRTGELRAAEWTEFSIDKAEWRIPAERMKMETPHIVPLSQQSLAILTDLQKKTGNRQYLFPNQRNLTTCMSENTMLYALYRMGYHSRLTCHGFRSTASTILNDSGLFAPDVIERQLAHCERNPVRAAYNHAQYLPERRKMMQWWADRLDELAKKKPQ
jgi:integrase